MPARCRGACAGACSLRVRSSIGRDWRCSTSHFEDWIASSAIAGNESVGTAATGREALKLAKTAEAEVVLAYQRGGAADREFVGHPLARGEHATLGAAMATGEHQHRQRPSHQ